MADNKINKALYGPSMLEVFLGALLGLLAGVLAAALFLALLKPALQVKEMPKEPSRSVVYFLPGSENNAKSKNWQAKQKQFLAGTRIQVVEDELNAWSASLTAPPPDPAKPAAKPKPGDKPAAPAAEGFLIPAKPNFRIIGDKLQIGLKCTLNFFGIATDVTVQATGGFRKDGDHFVFAPDTLYLGSCPVHMLPWASAPLVDHIIKNENIPDAIGAAWAKLTVVAIEGGSLKLAVQ
jgi:hypothetical protein